MALEHYKVTIDSSAAADIDGIFHHIAFYPVDELSRQARVLRVSYNRRSRQNLL